MQGSKMARLPAQHQFLVKSALIVLDQALAADDFVAASQLIEIALKAAPKSKIPTTRTTSSGSDTANSTI